ncbi:hypothetical protein LTR17_020166 [Elasticomyces elasticus]|nr:hypothetical protein LTR17_020166 [Elasticomyces elasticus]
MLKTHGLNIGEITVDASHKVSTGNVQTIVKKLVRNVRRIFKRGPWVTPMSGTPLQRTYYDILLFLQTQVVKMWEKIDILRHFTTNPSILFTEFKRLTDSIAAGKVQDSTSKALGTNWMACRIEQIYMYSILATVRSIMLYSCQGFARRQATKHLFSAPDVTSNIHHHNAFPFHTSHNQLSVALRLLRECDTSVIAIGRSKESKALKKHTRLAPRDRPTHLPAVQSAIVGYIPCLLVLNAASGLGDVGTERVDRGVRKPLEVEW